MNTSVPTPSKTPGRPLPTWIKAIALILILVGIGFRATNLDLKPFWEDEVYTITRVSGYQMPTISEQIDQQRLTVKDLEKYRDPQAGQSWLETMSALASTPEHTPLYFMLLRVWSGIFGHSTIALRSLSVVLSVAGFGVFYLIGRSLFPTDPALGDAAGWGAVTLASLSPLLMRYSQETRSYALWIIWMGLSILTLLRAWRSPNKRNWSMYGITLVLAFYTHFLSLLIIISQGIALIIHGLLNRSQDRWQKLPFKSWILTTFASGLVMAPWFVLIMTRRDDVQERTGWLSTSFPLDRTLWSWGQGLVKAWLEIPSRLQPVWYVVALGAFVGVAIASTYLWRHSQRDSILTLLSFTLVPTLAILALDLISGGKRSTVDRYFISTYVGLVALTGSALGVALAGRVGQRRLSIKTLGLWAGSALLILLSLSSLRTLHQGTTWWYKSSYIPTFTSAMEERPNTVLVTDQRIAHVLALAFALPPDQEVVWIEIPDEDDNPPAVSSLPVEDNEGIFLYSRSEKLDQNVKDTRPGPLPEPAKWGPSILQFLPPSKS